MVEGNAGESYLLIDVGHVLSRAAYVSRVEGTARLIALAEANTKHLGGSSLLDGVRRATVNLEMILGRQVVDRTGELRRPADADGHGINSVVVTTSLAPALRVVLVGLTHSFSLASAIRAATQPYVALERVIALEGSAQRLEARDLEALVERPPDVVVLVGGADGGPVAPIREMGEALSAAYSLLSPNKRPLMVFAGNERAFRPLAAAFAGVSELHAVSNVRPMPQKENLSDLQHELGQLFYSRRISSLEGLRLLGQWACTELVHDLDAMDRTLRFVARRHGLGSVLGVDVGANGTRVLHVRPQGASHTWTAPFGSGAGLAALRRLGSHAAVVRWMYHDLPWVEVWDRLSNAEARPGGIPQTAEDWDIQQAAVREALRETWKGALAAWDGYLGEGSAAGEVDMVVARGTVFSHARTPGQAALVLIDALQPKGLVRLALDWANLVPGLGALARLDAAAALQVLDHDGLLDLGTLVAPSGLVRAGSEALRLRLMVGGRKRAELSVPVGSIRRVPLGVNEHGRLDLYPARGMDLGLGRPGQGGAVEVRGGTLGVIVDARGRPLRVPTGEVERRAALEAWQREIDRA